MNDSCATSKTLTFQESLAGLPKEFWLVFTTSPKIMLVCFLHMCQGLHTLYWWWSSTCNKEVLIMGIYTPTIELMTIPYNNGRLDPSTHGFPLSHFTLALVEFTQKHKPHLGTNSNEKKSKVMHPHGKQQHFSWGKSSFCLIRGEVKVDGSEVFRKPPSFRSYIKADRQLSQNSRHSCNHALKN